jgi:hypothetical protein
MMALPRFFDRIYAAAGGVLAIDREALQQQLAGVSVGVRLDAAWATNPNARRLADLVVNLLARLYGRLVLAGPDDWCDTAAALVRSINPEVAIEAGDPTYAIVVGNDAWGANAIFARADGWVARVLQAPLDATLGPSNPLAAGAAAALATSEIFRRAFAPLSQLAADVNVSLLDHGQTSGADDELAHVRLGDVAAVGLGAVANGAVWALSELAQVDGGLTLVDAQAIDFMNLQRYVLAREASVGVTKVGLAAAALRRCGVALVETVGAFEDVAERISAPTSMVSVDNIPTRRAVQAMLPRLVINGWTGERGLGASWHELGHGPCVACAYHPRGIGSSQYELIAHAFGLSQARVTDMWVQRLDLTKGDLQIVADHLKVDRKLLRRWTGKSIQSLYTDVQCGAVSLDLTGVGRLESVPLAHQSCLAGILMAAELVKRTDPKWRARSGTAPYVSWADVMHRPPRFWTHAQQAHPRCFCGDSLYRETYQRKWGAVT